MAESGAPRPCAAAPVARRNTTTAAPATGRGFVAWYGARAAASTATVSPVAVSAVHPVTGTPTARRRPPVGPSSGRDKGGPSTAAGAGQPSASTPRATSLGPAAFRVTHGPTSAICVSSSTASIGPTAGPITLGVKASAPHRAGRPGGRAKGTRGAIVGLARARRRAYLHILRDTTVSLLEPNSALLKRLRAIESGKTQRCSRRSTPSPAIAGGCSGHATSSSADGVALVAAPPAPTTS